MAGACTERVNELRDQRGPAAGNGRFVSVCGGTGCLALGSEAVVAALRGALKEARLATEVVLRETGCHGFCERGPLVVVHPQEVFYQQVKPWQLQDVADASLRYAPPVRLSEDFFYYALTVGCWRSARTSRTSTSRLNLFRNPSWGIIGAASARAGFLELVSDYPEDDTP